MHGLSTASAWSTRRERLSRAPGGVARTHIGRRKPNPLVVHAARRAVVRMRAAPVRRLREPGRLDAGVAQDRAVLAADKIEGAEPQPGFDVEAAAQVARRLEGDAGHERDRALLLAPEIAVIASLTHLDARFNLNLGAGGKAALKEAVKDKLGFKLEL